MPNEKPFVNREIAKTTVTYNPKEGTDPGCHVNENYVRQLLEKHGLIPFDAPPQRGVIVRCATTDAPNKMNGAYWLSSSDHYPILYVQNWAQDEKAKRYPLGFQLKDLDPAKRKALEAEQQERLAAFMKAKEERHLEAEKEVNEFWDSLEGSDPMQSEYLRRKLPSLTVNKETFGNACPRFDVSNGALVVPLYMLNDASERLVNVQKIFPDGAKRFWPGGRLSGCFHPISWTPDSDRSTLILCEGWATGISIRTATGCGIWCSMTANNLANVAIQAQTFFRGQKLDLRFIVCCDHDMPCDRHLDPSTNQPIIGGTGRALGEAAARAIHAGWCMPYPNEEFTKADFNDLHCQKGIEAV